VDPVVRTESGVVRPMTTLRTENGNRFRNLSDMRKGVSMTGFKNGHAQSFATTNTPMARGFSSPDARRSAQAIYSRSMANMRTSRIRERHGISNERRHTAPSAPGRQFNTPSRDGERRSYAPERVFRSSTISPSMRQGAPVRSFAKSDIPSYSVGRYAGSTNSVRSYRGNNGWHNNGAGSRSYGTR